MANFRKLILTNAGLQEQYKAQSGTPLKFKRIGMGSGKFTGDVATLTKLVTENVSVNISKGYMQNNAFVVEGFFSNEGLTTGFAWREIGVFVEDSNGKEVLYCYSNAGDTYDYIPATADERYSKYIRVVTAIGNATNITIVDSEGFIYVDRGTFDAAVEEFRTEIDQLWPSKIAAGEGIFIKDSANLPLLGMNIYGKSTQNGTPTPDAPVEIISVENPTVNVYGKNLCNMNAFNSMGANGTSNSYDADTHTITLNADASSISGRYGSPVKVLPVGKKCTVSFDIRGTAGRIVKCGWDKKKTAITLTNTYQRYSSTMVITVETEPISFYTELASLGGLQSGEYMQFANVQVEYGDTATEYEEYKTKQALDLSTPNGLRGIPVSSGGNYTDSNGQEWICDEIDLARGVYIQRTEKFIFTENDVLSSLSNTKRVRRDANGVNNSKALCSVTDNLVYNATLDSVHYYVTGSHVWVFVPINYDLNNNPVEVIYQLATPIETALTAEEIAAFKAIKAQNPNTSILNDGGAEMSVLYTTKTYEAALAGVIVEIPSALPNPNALTFTGAATGSYDGTAAKTVNIPTVPSALKNPQALTFTGGATGSYDGSAAKSVAIPTALKCPNKLTINGTSYDGSAAVNVGEIELVGTDEAGNTHKFYIVGRTGE